MDRLGVEWLNEGFEDIIIDDVFASHFQNVSDTLGYLVRGNYNSNEKKAALLELLGPSFFSQHIR